MLHQSAPIQEPAILSMAAVSASKTTIFPARCTRPGLFREGDTGRTRQSAERLAAMLKRAGFPAEDVQVLG